VILSCIALNLPFCIWVKTAKASFAISHMDARFATHIQGDHRCPYAAAAIPTTQADFTFKEGTM